MGARLYESSLARVISAPRPLVWGLVGDSDRWDRAVGLNAGEYRWEQRDGQRVRVAKAREMGMEFEWVEPPYEWIEGLFVTGSRRFEGGPADTGGIRVRLEEDGPDRTRVETTFYVGFSGALSPILGRVMKGRFKKGLRRFLDHLEAAVQALPKRAVDPDGPPLAWPRQQLAAQYDAVLGGPRTEPDVAALERRARTLREEGCDAGCVEALTAFLRERADEEVAQMRPFELATSWGRDRRQTLQTFLHATRAGLVDLRWQINCPVCRVSARIADGLDEVRPEVHCDACNIDYDVTFGDHVEAVFTSNPAIRQVFPAVYCASSPVFRPHVWAQLSVPAGEDRWEPTPLPIGEVLVRSLGARHSHGLELPEEEGTLRVVLEDDGLTASFDPEGEAGVRIDNRSSAPAVVSIERAGWSADAVLGSVVASFPDFLDLFATEAPAAGVELSVGNLSVLFTDLTGSTAKYEAVGDARAFALVQEHFDIMEGVVRDHEGAVVKTMGDAVMATFSSPGHAARAAVEMIRRHDARFDDLGVKVGFYTGPCLAVRANDRMDFFGTTVNVAARLQGKAGSAEVVVTEAEAAHPQVAAAFEGLASEPFDADLRGIAATQKLVKVRVA